jgi:hypothetical protein
MESSAGSARGVPGERPGLFHFVQLRPYYSNMHFLKHLHLFHAIVGAQWNEVE